MYKPLNLKKLSDIDIKFYNTFIGTSRLFPLIVGKSKYYVTLHEKILELKHQSMFELDVAGENVCLYIKNYPVLEYFNQDFSGIDLSLLPDPLSTEVANVVFGELLNQLTAFLNLNCALKCVSFDTSTHDGFEKTVGFSVINDSSQKIIVGNLAANQSFLEKLIISFEKIPASRSLEDHDVDFEVFLEAGKTTLSREEYESLEENDIIFLDDDAHIRSGVFDICGIDPIKASGVFKNGKFEITNVIK